MKENNKKTIDKIISILCIVICCFVSPILIGNIILIIKGNVDKERIPSLFGYSPLAVETDSMFPIFSGGDLIIIKHCKSNEVGEGDIVSYYEPSVTDHSVIVTHRVMDIQVNENGTVLYITKGDANNTNDNQAISEEYLIGKYFGHLRGVGSFIVFLSSTKGMLLCVVLPIFVLISVDYIKRLFERKNKSKNSNDI